MTDPVWHTLPFKDVLDRLHATPQGLSTADAQRRLKETGPNRIERDTRRPAIFEPKPVKTRRR